MHDPTHNPSSNDQDKIERMKRRLYSRAKPAIFEDKRSEMNVGEHEVKTAWDDDATAALPRVESKDPVKRSVASKIFIAALAFFVLSVGVAFFMYAGGLNRISSKNVDISVVGPVSVSGGEPFTLEMVVRNDNAVALEDVALTVRFPEGARLPDNIANPLVVERFDLGTIQAGQTGRKTMRIILFGEKDTVKDIAVAADYKIKASNAGFQKEKLYQIAIKSSPLIVTIDYPKEINAGHEMEFKVELSSNTNTVLEDIVVRAEFPFGFVFKGSDPKPYYENSVWQVGDFKPLEKKVLTVRGILEGQHNEERTFRFYTGKVSEDDDRHIGVNLTSATLPVVIKKLNLAIDLKFESGEREGYGVMPAGGFSNGLVQWRNNLPVNLLNVIAEAKISGPMYKREGTIANSGGYFRSIDNTVVWDKSTNESLAQVAPGASGTLAFGFPSFPVTSELISAIKDPEITVEVRMEGSRTVEGGLPEKIVATTEKKVRIGTEIALMPRAVYSVGPFKNTGPMPPKADEKTTYTIIWAATNTFNDVSGGRVVAQLPPYVKWLGVTSPANERVSFNPITQEVVWDIGELKRGAGFISSPREVAFQIELTPSLSHVDNAPVILKEAKLTGRDNFTGASLSKDYSTLTTMLSTDPNQKFDWTRVVK